MVYRLEGGPKLQQRTFAATCASRVWNSEKSLSLLIRSGRGGSRPYCPRPTAAVRSAAIERWCSQLGALLGWRQGLHQQRGHSNRCQRHLSVPISDSILVSSINKVGSSEGGRFYSPEPSGDSAAAWPIFTSASKPVGVIWFDQLSARPLNLGIPERIGKGFSKYDKHRPNITIVSQRL